MTNFSLGAGRDSVSAKTTESTSLSEWPEVSLISHEVNRYCMILFHYTIKGRSTILSESLTIGELLSNLLLSFFCEKSNAANNPLRPPPSTKGDNTSELSDSLYSLRPRN